MPEVSQFIFKLQEVTELLIKKQEIHEGYWKIMFRFGIHGANIDFGGSGLLPAAMVPILEIGIQRVNELDSLAIDAAKVNPLPSSTGKKRKTKG